MTNQYVESDLQMMINNYLCHIEREGGERERESRQTDRQTDKQMYAFKKITIDVS